MLRCVGQLLCCCGNTQLTGSKTLNMFCSDKMYKQVCPGSIQPCAMKNRHLRWRYRIQETLYTGQGCLSSLQSRQLGAPHCSPIFVDCSLYTLNILRCSACCRPSRTWATFKRFLIIFEAFVPHFYLFCAHCIIPQNLLNHPNSLCRGMFKLNTKFDADSLLYSLSHFECDGHRVHILTQWCLLLPLTSTMTSSLFMGAHSSPISLAAGLHHCCANCSRYINNGQTFSRQP